MDKPTTQAINEARDKMESRRQCWIDSVHERAWNQNWETPFGDPVTGSFRAYVEASKDWAELVLKANGYDHP